MAAPSFPDFGKVGRYKSQPLEFLILSSLESSLSPVKKLLAADRTKPHPLKIANDGAAIFRFCFQQLTPKRERVGQPPRTIPTFLPTLFITGRWPTSREQYNSGKDHSFAIWGWPLLPGVGKQPVPSEVEWVGPRSACGTFPQKCCLAFYVVKMDRAPHLEK
jgi:hypothetical protein